MEDILWMNLWIYIQEHNKQEQLTMETENAVQQGRGETVSWNAKSYKFQW